MSFGYSVGDFLTGANVAIKMYHMLATTKCSTVEHAEIMLELKILEETFNGIVALSKNLAVRLDTLKGAELLALASAQTIRDFLKRTKTAREKMSCPGTGNVISESWRKMGWANFKQDELKVLKDGLHERQSHIQMILQLAQLQGSTTRAPESKAGDRLEVKNEIDDDEITQLKVEITSGPSLDSAPAETRLNIIIEEGHEDILGVEVEYRKESTTKKNSRLQVNNETSRTSSSWPQPAISRQSSPPRGAFGKVDRRTKFSKWNPVSSSKASQTPLRRRDDDQMSPSSPSTNPNGGYFDLPSKSSLPRRPSAHGRNWSNTNYQSNAKPTPLEHRHSRLWRALYGLVMGGYLSAEDVASSASPSMDLALHYLHPSEITAFSNITEYNDKIESSEDLFNY